MDETKDLDFLVRNMIKDDIKAVESLHFKCFGKKYDIESDFINPLYLLMVAVLNEQIIGYFNILIVSGSAEIINIAVHEDFRKKGVASSLLRSMENESKKRNCNKIFLEVARNNTAYKLYKDFGFIEIHTRKKYYGDTDALIMEKVL